jgi:chemotaxis protein methyltransferase CheR
MSRVEPSMPIMQQQPTVTDESLGSPFRAYEFSDADFRRLKRMIFDYAGISLNDNKKPMAYSRLTKRIRQLGHANFREYLDFVEHADSEEHVRFINALTTNLTYFFREAHHFTILAEHLLKVYDDEPLTIWSAACSTGEEPYSIAMAVIEAFGSDTPPVRIIASDLDTDALASAQRGVYALDKVASLTPQRLKRFFLKGSGDQAGFARIRPRFSDWSNSAGQPARDSWPIDGPLAAIFCHNVMIYFNKGRRGSSTGCSSAATRRPVVRRPFGEFFLQCARRSVFAARPSMSWLGCRA